MHMEFGFPPYAALLILELRSVLDNTPYYNKLVTVSVDQSTISLGVIVISGEHGEGRHYPVQIATTAHLDEVRGLAEQVIAQFERDVTNEDA